MAYLLGMDVSTTAVKALIINPKGELIGSAATEQRFASPKPLWSEQEPEQWWRSALASIRGALTSAGIAGEQVKAVGLTGQMHGLTLLDEDHRVLRPAILWNDQRCAAECDEIRKRVGQGLLIQTTGNDALTGFTAPKILWVRNHEPPVYARIRHILLPKDYVRWMLTGDMAVDVADGAGTILFDLKQRTWSEKILNALDIPAAWLPKTYEGPAVTGVVNASAAQLTGLSAGTPVIAGGGDQAAQAVGVGAVNPGVVALTLGTSGVVFATTGEPFIEPEGRLHAFCHAVPGRWHLMGVMLAAAGSLRWYRDTLAPGMSYDELLAQAADVPPGCEGLQFLPYLSGERTPHADHLARGGFIGLTLRHGQPHLTRAVLEGVAFGLRDSFELIRAAGLAHIDQVRVSGGGARSGLWRQILADVFGCELATVNTSEGAAYGAALLAGVGSGIWESVDAACEACIRVTGAAQPDSGRNAAYERHYPVYRALYPALQGIFPLLAPEILDASPELRGTK